MIKLEDISIQKDEQITIQKHKKARQRDTLKVHNCITESKDPEMIEVPDKEFKSLILN